MAACRKAGMSPRKSLAACRMSTDNCQGGDKMTTRDMRHATDDKRGRRATGRQAPVEKPECRPLVGRPGCRRACRRTLVACHPHPRKEGSPGRRRRFKHGAIARLWQLQSVIRRTAFLPRQRGFWAKNTDASRVVQRANKNCKCRRHSDFSQGANWGIEFCL